MTLQTKANATIERDPGYLSLILPAIASFTQPRREIYCMARQAEWLFRTKRSETGEIQPFDLSPGEETVWVGRASLPARALAPFAFELNMLLGRAADTFGLPGIGPAGRKGGNLNFPNQNCLNLLTFGLTGSVLLLHLSCNPP